ncbi:MAG: hypothetical protein ACF8XB_07405 [Planctomycetota bacterium JB042]
MKLIVAKGRSILLPDRSQITEGQTVPLDRVSRDLAREYVRSGFAVEASSGPSVFDEDDRPPEDPRPPQDDRPPGQRDAPPFQKWGLDPDGLTGLSLEQLNLLVRERDPDIEPFDTVEEAVVQLSHEYVAPTGG